MDSDETAHLYDDEDNRRWQERFGEPYVEDDYHGCDLDSASLQKLEAEFYRAADDRRSAFDTLESVDGE
jgi:hypothetical protein